jgi:mono/diheme cytochrome c family protein
MKRKREERSERGGTASTFFSRRGVERRLALLSSAAAALVLCAPLASADSPSTSGKAVFEKWCAPCHAPGPNHPGTTALQALYKGKKPAALEERKDLAPAITKQFVRQGVSVMPFFRKTEISDSELDALATYLAHKG